MEEQGFGLVLNPCMLGPGLSLSIPAPGAVTYTRTIGLNRGVTGWSSVQYMGLNKMDRGSLLDFLTKAAIFSCSENRQDNGACAALEGRLLGPSVGQG